mgnify:CR=1 FL=1
MLTFKALPINPWKFPFKRSIFILFFEKKNISRAMTGSVPFEEALAARLSLFKPSLGQVEDCMEKRPPR